MPSRICLSSSTTRSEPRFIVVVLSQEDLHPETCMSVCPETLVACGELCPLHLSDYKLSSPQRSERFLMRNGWTNLGHKLPFVNKSWRGALPSGNRRAERSPHDAEIPREFIFCEFVFC